MASTPMDLDPVDTASPANGTPSTSLYITRTIPSNLPSTSSVPDIIANFRPTKLFKRDEAKDGRSQPYVLSLDYDDPGELLMTSESDEAIQIYKIREGRHDKQLLSKKYGVKLAKFTRNSSSIIYASTKQNDAIRYLTTHDNAFIRYFEGHEGAVTNLAMHPGSDDFISCSTKGGGHFLLDSFKGHLKAYLRKPEGRTGRLAPGEEAAMNGGWNSTNVESSGDCCFTPDGRFVIGGSKQGVVVWDTLAQPEENKTLSPAHTIEDPRQAAVVAFNPRFNFFATADQEVLFWLPDPHA
ncbi:hypothetical protein ONZ43_g3581 [Nemania bipapillata]|uniref:Uncharacterized protein n=1 Tax=Nemania bipapillata TaxID=110536 RepID=A0ACC2IW86_9PEZI|nr:hypothetical protein ONZ43_g3581 [Nemania bipapillata]